MEAKISDFYPFDDTPLDGNFVLCIDESMSGNFAFKSLLIKHAITREEEIHIICISNTPQNLEAVLRKNVGISSFLLD
jgi:hypothetical protein